MSTKPAMPEWASPDGPWCLRQWITDARQIGPQVVVVCLLDRYHDGDCRDQSGMYRSVGQRDICLPMTIDGRDADERAPLTPSSTSMEAQS